MLHVEHDTEQNKQPTFSIVGPSKNLPIHIHEINREVKEHSSNSIACQYGIRSHQITALRTASSKKHNRSLPDKWTTMQCRIKVCSTYQNKGGRKMVKNWSETYFLELSVLMIILNDVKQPRSYEFRQLLAGPHAWLDVMICWHACRRCTCTLPPSTVLQVETVWRDSTTVPCKCLPKLHNPPINNLIEESVRSLICWLLVCDDAKLHF